MRKTGQRLAEALALAIVAAAFAPQSGLPQAQLPVGAAWDIAGGFDIDGDGWNDLAVGAPFFSAAGEAEGAVFVYRGNPVARGFADLELRTVIVGDSPGGHFGWSVAMVDDLNGDGHADLVVGAPRSSRREPSEGAYYVFTDLASSGQTASSARASAVAFGAQPGAQLGWSVAGAGDVNGDGLGDFIVGARGYDAGHRDSGAAFVFLGGGTAWQGQASVDDAYAVLHADEPRAWVGWSVAGVGDLDGDGRDDVAVGAPNFTRTLEAEGAVLVFSGARIGSGRLGPASASSLITGGRANARFGTSVAGAGDVNGDGLADLIVGAPFHGTGERVDGAAFVFHGEPGGIGVQVAGGAHASVVPGVGGSRFGWSVAGLGDLDADGFDDLAVASASQPGDPDEASGRLFVFGGSERGTNATTAAGAVATYRTGSAVSGSGRAIGRTGDIDGNGHADLFLHSVVLPDANPDRAPEIALILHGGKPFLMTDFANGADRRLQSGVLGDGFGSAALIIDLDGDRIQDLLVGAPRYSHGEDNEGAVFVFRGEPVPWGTVMQPLAVYESNHADAQFGATLSSAGDFNGDGTTDVAVGAPTYQDGEIGEGAVFVLSGGPGEPGERTVDGALLRIESGTPNSYFGTELAGGGDLDGDGLDDIVVSTPHYSVGAANEGAVFVIRGRAMPTATDLAGVAVTVSSGIANAGLGSALAFLGDVNGDGMDDFAATAAGFSTDDGTTGAVFVFGGSSDLGTLALDTSALLLTRHDGAEFGGALAPGDYDGDGLADLAIGAPGWTAQGDSRGTVFLVRGTADGVSSAYYGDESPRILAPSGLLRFGDQLSMAVGASGRPQIAIAATLRDGALVVTRHGFGTPGLLGQKRLAARLAEDAAFSVHLGGPGVGPLAHRILLATPALQADELTRGTIVLFGSDAEEF